jgi:hypothetical protein
MEFQSGAVQPIGSIEEGWNIIKADYWLFFAMTLVILVILFTISMVLGLINNGITFAVGAAVGVATQNSGEAGKISASFTPQIISLIISFFTNIIATAITGTFICGYFNALTRKVTTGVVEFGDIFSGFSYFQPCLIVSLILSLIQFVIGAIAILIFAAFGVAAFGTSIIGPNAKPDPNMIGALVGVGLVIFLFYFVVSIIVGICTVFAFPLVAGRRLSGFEAISLSARAGLGNAMGLLGFLLMQGLMLLGGALVLCIGILFVAPILYASLFAAYRSVFGIGNSNFNPQMPPPPPNFGNQYGNPSGF